LVANIYAIIWLRKYLMDFFQLIVVLLSKFDLGPAENYS